MDLPEYIRYVGRMKQPLQRMDVYAPSMFALSDSEKIELCLIILTPGAFCHAYDFIKKSGAKNVKIFFPTLRPEFISDIMNLYASLKNVMPIKWVFPEKYKHYSFSMGHEKCGVYIHPFDPMISIEYIKNPKVDRMYDILVKCEEGMHYFSLYMTDERCTELFYCKPCTFIHVSKSAPIYGGMCYDGLYNMNPKFKKKLVPFDFTSIEEYLLFRGNIVRPIETPKPPKPQPPQKEPDKWYPGHPPILNEGEPGRPIEVDKPEPKQEEVETKDPVTETPEGDDVNDTL